VKQVSLLSAAEDDIRRAASFYAEQAPGLGNELLTEVQRAFARLGEAPELGTPLPGGARRLLLRRFLYSVIYRILPERVLVLALGHQRRHPGFWLRRG
jgi:plasmid stabilization system protein ParE